MSLKPKQIDPVPRQTKRVAKAAFPKGNLYLTLRDQLGPIFQDQDFSDLFPKDGQPALPPWRLALVTILQFRENLPDRQAAEAVRGRIDWKYLLGLELTDAGFDFSVLSEFRTRLLEGGGEAWLLDKLLEQCQSLGLAKARGTQRTDATRVLAAIRVLNRLELVGETMRAALNDLATVAPDWLRSAAPTEWYHRYSRRIEDNRLPESPEKRQAYAQMVGEDGFQLLDLLQEPDAPLQADQLSGVEALRRVLARHYERWENPPDGLQVRFKSNRELPPAHEGIESPYDLEARFRSRHEITWTGYQVHLSETCDADAVHLITHVDTTQATVHESQRTETIHRALEDKDLPPQQHLVDAAYIDAEVLISSQESIRGRRPLPTTSNNIWSRSTSARVKPVTSANLAPVSTNTRSKAASLRSSELLPLSQVASNRTRASTFNTGGMFSVIWGGLMRSMGDCLISPSSTRNLKNACKPLYRLLTEAEASRRSSSK